jgi:hypothetical protein
MNKGNACFLLLALLILPVFGAMGQNFIGYDETGIAERMKAAHPQFKQDKTVVNDTYKYLKYVDRITEQTILFFLSDKGECTYVRWMSDYSNLNDMLAMLNSKYKKSGKDSWTYSEKGQNYTVSMEEGEWYFTVSFRKN